MIEKNRLQKYVKIFSSQFFFAIHEVPVGFFYKNRIFTCSLVNIVLDMLIKSGICTLFLNECGARYCFLFVVLV